MSRRRFYCQGKPFVGSDPLSAFVHFSTVFNDCVLTITGAREVWHIERGFRPLDYLQQFYGYESMEGFSARVALRYETLTGVPASTWTALHEAWIYA